MKRDLGVLANNHFDVLVVGGGIYGACVAWDAAQRRLKVALVEQGDFGSATSSNSMKTVHGGLRYLKDMNFGLMRLMIAERRAWLTMAPHLVRPLPMLYPTSGRGLHSRPVLQVALKTTDLIGFDRNRGLDDELVLPPSRVLDRTELMQYMPGLPAAAEFNGAAMWYDAQITNTEQLLVSVLKSAVEHGAAVANYVCAESFLLEDGATRGALVRDVETGSQFQIRASFVINAAGPWVETLLSPHGQRRPLYPLSRAVNVVVPQVIEGVGVGLRSNAQMKGDTNRPRAGKTLFVVPWRGMSILGTMHGVPVTKPGQAGSIEPEIERLIGGINEAYPAAGLNRGSVLMVHAGLQPLDPDRGRHGRPDLLRESRLIDHRRADGTEGLVSIIGAKFTSARWIAQLAVDHVLRRLDIPAPRSRTRVTPVFGGQLDSIVGESERLGARYPTLTQPAIEQLVTTYGSEAPKVLAWSEGDPSLLEAIAGQGRVLRCQVLYAVHEEMARRTSDFVLRRSELGSVGPPAAVTVREVSALMASALGASGARFEEQGETPRDLSASASYESNWELS